MNGENCTIKFMICTRHKIFLGWFQSTGMGWTGKSRQTGGFGGFPYVRQTTCENEAYASE